MKPRLSLVVACGRNREIGRDNRLLWSLPDDLKRFREITSGHPVILGRKTHESIGRALPGRRNIVISRQPGYAPAPGAETAASLREALELASEPGGGEIFVIGGAEIYRLALPEAGRIYLTRVEGSFEADTFFPAWTAEEFVETSREWHGRDERHAFEFSFLVLDRIG
ncbi:MAG: dihydrofolate reductase [Oligoflexia bacterium]|nr:dihydrofolate reductase [Oligoflexia bacterium]